MTELGPLPEEWEVAKLGGLADTKAGGTPSTLRSEFWDGDIPWINSGALKDRVITEPTRYITKLGLENSVAKLLPVNSVVIALTGATTGKVGILKFACSTNQSVVGILSNQQFDSVFIFYTLMYSRERIIGLKSGAAQPHINKQIVDNFTISLPPLPEQRAIARMLSTIQKAIEAQDKIIAAARELKKSLMHHLFTYGSVPFPEAERVPLKETEIGLIPEHWERTELRDLTDIVYGVQAAVANLTDSSLGIPILTNINIRNDGTLDLSTLRYYPLPNNKRDRLLLKKSDVLFNWRSGSPLQVGKTAIFDLDGDYTFSSFILRFRVKNDSISKQYLFRYLNFLKDIGFFTSRRSQSSVNSVFNASLAAKIPVFLPPPLDQTRISTMLMAADSKIETEEKCKAALQALFKTMLHLLMRGQVRVKDLEAQVA